jgi:hypothetical protein
MTEFSSHVLLYRFFSQSTVAIELDGDTTAIISLTRYHRRVTNNEIQCRRDHNQVTLKDRRNDV